MMVQAIVLGIVQGLTEFLPVSSSAHLAILEKIFKITDPVVLATFLHFGTLLATVVFFFDPIISIIKGLIKGKKEAVKYVASIIIGSIPAGIFALFLRSEIERSFSDIRLVALLLGITGVVLLLTGVVRKAQGKVNFFSALIIGIGQMFAVFPGFSRSGFTISAGLFSGVDPKEAFRFSFLLSLPAVLGANLLELKNIDKISNPLTLFVGVLCAFIFGLLALRILRDLVSRRFHLFGIYCLAVSVLVLLLK